MSDEYLEFPGGKVRKDDVVAYEQTPGWARLVRFPISIGLIFIALSSGMKIQPTRDDYLSSILAIGLIGFALYLAYRSIKGKLDNDDVFLFKFAGVVIGAVGLYATALTLSSGYPSNLIHEISIFLIGALLFKFPAIRGHTVHKVTLRSGNIIKRNSWGN